MQLDQILGLAALAIARVVEIFGAAGFDIGIPRSRDNPEVCWVNDTEIVGDLVAINAPALWHAVAQEVQHCAAKIRERGVAFVVGELSVHQPP